MDTVVGLASFAAHLDDGEMSEFTRLGNDLGEVFRFDEGSASWCGREGRETMLSEWHAAEVDEPRFCAARTRKLTRATVQWNEGAADT